MGIMRRIMASAPAIMVCTVAYPQVAEMPVQPYENTIQVNGTAEREVVPDEIYVRIIISENDTKGKVSVDKMEQDMINVLSAAGIDVENDLRVGDMSASAYQKTFGKRSARTTATYQLKVNSAAMLGRVYQDLAQAGIMNLGVIRVNHSRIREINDELRVEAVKNARHIARTMAEALGQGVGKAVFVVDYNQVPMYSRVATEMAVADYSAGGAAAPLELDFRNIKLNYSVTVKFILE